jgi:tetraacyldisaccharide 4'-kinase
VGARVASLGNLTVGGTGKTTLALHLAARARERGIECAIVCRRYRPGPAGAGDEELLFRERLAGAAVFAGTRKLDLARAAAARGARLILVDDAFSHWALARDADVVLLDASDPLGGGRLLPEGRLREPLRALQRAQACVVTRLDPSRDSGALISQLRELAPAARFATARHEILGAYDASGGRLAPGSGVVLLTATGNPQAVLDSARAEGLNVVQWRFFRDHHWFTRRQVEEWLETARASAARLLLTAKDAVRWPPERRGEIAILQVRWQWIEGGAAVEALVFGDDEA